jgi:hypothetical protein
MRWENPRIHWNSRGQTGIHGNKLYPTSLSQTSNSHGVGNLQEKLVTFIIEVHMWLTQKSREPERTNPLDAEVTVSTCQHGQHIDLLSQG